MSGKWVPVPVFFGHGERAAHTPSRLRTRVQLVTLM